MENNDPIINTWENPLDFNSVFKFERDFKFEVNPTNKIKRKIAIITSGGDSPGMNAAVRSAVRMGIKSGVTMLAVKDGYEGLVNDCIFKLEWQHVSGILQIVRKKIVKLNLFYPNIQKGRQIIYKEQIVIFLKKK